MISITLGWSKSLYVTFVTLLLGEGTGYVSESYLRAVPRSQSPSKAATSKPIHASGSPVKVRAALILLRFIMAATIAYSASSQPVSTTQIAAWLTAGVSQRRLAQLVEERGLATLPTKAEIHDLEAVGAGKELLHALNSSNAQSAKIGDPIPAALSKAAAEAHRQNWHEAEVNLRLVLSSGVDDSAIHLALGAMLREQEQWDAAFDELAEATQLMPDLPENHDELAYLFYRIDDGPNAVAEARTALSLDPKNAAGYQYLGLAHYSVGQYGPAVHAFAESLVRDPDNADTYYDMGIALHADGNLPGALAAYQHAIRLRPGFWEAHSNLALILHERGDLVQAVAEYREAKKLAPGEASVRNNLGNTYCDQGNFDAAVNEFRELYRQHPEWQQGHTCLASAYMAKRNFDGAVEELRLAVRLNPNGSAEHRVLGQALLLASQPDEAIKELRLAVSLNPDSDLAHHLLGTALYQQQDLHGAEREFREALRLKGTADNHYALAACLMSLDRYDEALSELETAARLDPSQSLYRARREELLKLLKDSKAQ